MLKVRRILILTLSMAVLLSSFLTACGSKEAADTTASTGSSTVAGASDAANTTKEADLPEVKLTWYVLSNSQPDDELVYAEANKYIKEKINATVDFYPLNQAEYNDKIKVKLAGQEPIDVVFTSYWLNSYGDNIAKGAIRPLDELLDKYGAELKASIPEKYWEAAKLKKIGDDKARLYGVPNYQIEASVTGLAFRKDLAEKYNLVDAINNLKNYDDLTPILKTIKENEPNVFPLIDANLTPEGKYELTTEPYRYVNINVGATIDLETMQVLGLDDPELSAAELKLAQIRRDWYLKGYIDKDAVNRNADLEPKKKQGKAFMYLLGACKPGVETEEKAKYGYDIIAKQTRAPITSIAQVTSTMNAIPTSSENPERAMMLLNLVNTDKSLYNLLNFGIEGTHYTKIDDNTIEVLKDSKFNPSMAWALGNQFNAFVQKGQPADVWEQTIKLNETAIPDPLEGFAFNSEPVKTELAQIQTVTDKYQSLILSGGADPVKTLEKRNKEYSINDNWKKVYAEVKKQFEEWKKANGK